MPRRCLIAGGRATVVVGNLSLFLRAAEAPPTSSILLTEVTRQTGIDFVHTDGSSGQRYIVETVSAGLATFDFDGDGKIDILFLNGAPLGEAKTEPPPTCRLYRNVGNWKFTDVTRKAGLAVTCYALGVAVGDYDSDGHPDVFLNNFGTRLHFGLGSHDRVDRLEVRWLGGGTNVVNGVAAGSIDQRHRNPTQANTDAATRHCPENGWRPLSAPRERRANGIPALSRLTFLRMLRKLAPYQPVP